MSYKIPLVCGRVDEVVTKAAKYGGANLDHECCGATLHLVTCEDMLMKSQEEHETT